MSWFYTVEPKYKECTKEELLEYVKQYPRKLSGDGYMGYISYYDFSTAPYFPEALLVARYNFEYGESDWRICINAEEVFNSRIPNRWAEYDYKTQKWVKTINGERVKIGE